MPSSRAGAAAASQSATTRDRNAWPAGASSVDLGAAGVAVPADRGGDDERLGPWRGRRQHAASARVASTRLARISAL